MRKETLCRILQNLSICLFTISGGMLYAFVYDVEPISPEKRYELERSVFNRSNDNFHATFPDFYEWQIEQDRKEQKFHDYLQALAQKLGEECAYAFDWTYTGKKDASEPMSAEEWRCAYGD